MIIGGGGDSDFSFVEFFGDVGDDVGRVLEKVWDLLDGPLFGKDDIEWYGNPDPGNIPIILQPPTGEQISPQWMEAGFYGSDTVNFEVRCTATNGCDDFAWYLQRYNPDTSQFESVENDFWDSGEFRTQGAFNRIGGFEDQGYLYRTKVWQSNSNEEDWTIRHDDWRYFFNGTPAEAPETPAVISPSNGEQIRGNFIFFMVQNRLLEMMHPHFKYRIEIFKANADGTMPSTPIQVVNTVIPGPRGNAAPMGFNVDPVVVDNIDARYFWRAVAYYEDGEGNRSEESPSAFVGFDTLELPYVGDTQNSEFGKDVAISGRLAVVGAPNDSQHASAAGKAVVFRKDGDTWKRHQVISHTTSNRSFGNTVAIDGETIVIGNYHLDGTAGEARVYNLGSNGLWTLQKVFNQPSSVDGGFGQTVAISGDTIAIAAHAWFNDRSKGKVFIYRKSGSNWNFEAGIEANDPSGPGTGEDGEHFGQALAISGGDIIAGAYGRNDNGNDRGWSYAFSRVGSSWPWQQTLAPVSNFTQNQFGWSVDLQGRSAIIGAPGFLDGTFRGTAYPYELGDDNEWHEMPKLVANDAINGAQFGASVSMSGDVYIIGAPESLGEKDKTGSVYVFQKLQGENGPVWEQRTKWVDNPQVQEGRFGYSVDVDGANAVIGAPYDNSEDDNVAEDRRGSVTFKEIDVIPPVALVVSPFGPFITNQSSVAFNVVFNEVVQNVDVGKFKIETEGTVAHGPLTLGTLSDGRQWQLTVGNVTGTGRLTLSVRDGTAKASKIEDLNGNPLAATVKSTVFVDHTVPTFSAFTSPSQIPLGQPLLMRFNASEYVTQHPNVTVGGQAAELVGLKDDNNPATIDYAYKYVPQAKNAKLGSASVQIQVADNAGNPGSLSRSIEIVDQLQVLTELNSVTVVEGASAQLQVKLSGQPTVDVEVSVARVSGDPDVNPDPAPTVLKFTPSNWNIYQLATVRAAEDLDTVDSVATIRCSGASVKSKDVTAIEDDNDPVVLPTIEVTPNSIIVPEGGMASFQVKLSAQPAAKTTVNVVRVSGDSDINPLPNPTNLVFTTANWNINQTVTLSAAQDADTVDSVATIRCSASGLENEDITATEDDDPPAVFIRVTDPNGGEKWKKGQTYNITWDRSNSSGSKVKVELKRNGNLIKTIASNTPNDGLFAWTISADVLAGNGYKIWITSRLNNQIVDSSDGTFKIKNRR